MNEQEAYDRDREEEEFYARKEAFEEAMRVGDFTTYFINGKFRTGDGVLHDTHEQAMEHMRAERKRILESNTA